MKCPKCNCNKVYVLDSRGTEVDEQETTRRRRVCRGCKYRWTTIELPMGDRRHHDAIRTLKNIKESLMDAVRLIDGFDEGGEVK